MDSRRGTARVAGALYLLMGITSTVGLSIGSFVVRGDAAATAAKIASSQVLYRLCIVSELSSEVLFVALVLVLYRLLKEVHERLAALMVALVLVQVPMMFATMLCGIAPLVLLSGFDYWSAFDRPQLNALVIGSLRLRDLGVSAVTTLWGLWLLPFGLLVFRSGFIPRALGVILIVGCVGDVTMSVATLLFPAYEQLVKPLVVLGVGELLIILWLLIKGARNEPSAGRRSSTA
jgi:hypothetical protein